MRLPTTLASVFIGWVLAQLLLVRILMAPRLTRRRLLQRTALGAAGVTVAGVATACGQSNDPKGIGEVTIPTTEVPAVGAAPYRNDDGRFYLVHNDDGVLAFSWRCTHQGCDVPWEEGRQQFHCPCHNSLFDRNGDNISGPANRPLDLMPLRVLPSGEVAVNTDEVNKRKAYTPDQAVPYEQ